MLAEHEQADQLLSVCRLLLKLRSFEPQPKLSLAVLLAERAAYILKSSPLQANKVNHILSIWPRFFFLQRGFPPGQVFVWFLAWICPS